MQLLFAFVFTLRKEMSEHQGVHKLVLVRHGESVWNQQNKFCGWYDADLSAKGYDEAKFAGEALKKEGYTFDIAYTSVLTRAIKTLYVIQDTLNLHWIPVIRHWRLNERMYGGLQGLDKSETAKKHGEDQVKIWRRSYDIPPPPVEVTDPHYPGNDPRYKGLSPSEIPRTESLKDTVARFVPYLESEIKPLILSSKKVLITAHGNTIRAFVKHLDNVPDSQIVELNIPTGIPLVYELDDNFKPIKHYYLADDETVQKAIASVANQGKAK